MYCGSHSRLHFALHQTRLTPGKSTQIGQVPPSTNFGGFRVNQDLTNLFEGLARNFLLYEIGQFFHRRVPTHFIFGFPVGVRECLARFVGKSGETPPREIPIVTLKNCVHNYNSLEVFTFTLSFPTSINIVTVSVCLGSVRLS